MISSRNRHHSGCEMNAKSSTMTADIILTVIEVYFDDKGGYTACAHTGTWMCSDFPEHPNYVRIYKRGVHRVKLACYGNGGENLDEWGAWLCAALIDRNSQVWTHVDLGACDR